MDINAKKWTDFLWVKATALALSVALFVGFAITVFAWYRQSSQFGETIYYSTDHKAQLSFTDQEEFASEFSLDIEKIVSKTGAYAGESIRQQLLQEYDQNCAAFVAQYNKEKAAFIRTYLFDSLCQEDIYENYEDYFNTDVPLNVPQITIEKRVLVDAYAPAFVRDLQKILNGTDGNGFLRYAALIPDDALAGSVHDGQIQLSKEYFSYGSGFEYTLDLEDPAAYYKSVYEKFIADFDIAQVHRNSVLPASLRYYIFDPKTGTTFTNAECDKQT
ncbi:MAG: hypothetical protein IJN42_05465, partial [Clostridia bacterium]|nr:hypothetical protein [Clostridia bacterium]